MQATPTAIDKLLVAALRGDPSDWPADWGNDACPAVLERIRYHGVGGWLIDESRSNDWPSMLQEDVRNQATAQAMWEMRHRQVIADLVAKLARDGVRHVILKGTALAYGVYASPHLRSRADTDLLIEPSDVAATRAALRDCGFGASWGEMPDLDLAFQEGWQVEHADGSIHQLDLHWQAINALCLRDVMPVRDCLDHDAPLERLSPQARTLQPAYLLLHTCLHRLMHRTAPYVLGGRPYFGGDRLIWAVDVRKLADDLEDAGWEHFTELAIAAKVAPVCLDAFAYAERTIGIAVPAATQQRLAGAERDSVASRYLLESGRTRRALSNLAAGKGLRAATAFVKTQLFPSAEVLHVHYPRWAHLPTGLLLLRRWVGFALPKKSHGR